MVRLSALLAGALLVLAPLGCKKKAAPTDAGRRQAVVPRAIADAGPPPPKMVSWKEGLKSPDPKVRAEAAASILPMHHQKPPPELLAALRDKSAMVRRAAVTGVLGFILRNSDATALPQLLELAAKDRDVAVRGEAVRALGALSHRDVVPGLVKLFPREKNPTIRDEIFAIFAREGDRRAVKVLLPLLKKKAPPPLAFEALRRIADPRTVKPLLKLVDDPSGAIRSRAIQVLGAIGGARAVGKLVKALRDPNLGVVREAIVAVAQLSRPEAVRPLLKLLDSKEPGVRRRAVQALADYSDASALPAGPLVPKLLQLLRRDRPSVQVGAARLLGVLKSKRAVAALREAARSKQPLGLRSAALDSLGRIGSADALSTLTEALRDKRPAIRTEAAEAIGRLGEAGKAGAAALRAAWQRGEKSIDTRVAIVKALGLLEDAGAAALLRQAGEKDPVPVVRVEAGGALLKLGLQDGVRILEPILTGAEDWQERRAAARAIDVASPVDNLTALIDRALSREKEPLVREELYRKLGEAVGESAAKHQRHVLHEKVPIFRVMAADGLCGNGDPQGCAILTRSLGDPDATVRAEAARRLGRLKVGSARPALRKALRDPVVWVAAAAREALTQLKGGGR